MKLQFLALAVLVPALFASCTARGPIHQPDPLNKKARSKARAKVISSLDELKGEELASVLGIQWRKMVIPKSMNGGPWSWVLERERAGHPVEQLQTGLYPTDGTETFFGHMPAERGASELEFFHGYDTHLKIKNPVSAYRDLRNTNPQPLKPGRTVLMLWRDQNESGWEPGDATFVQRIVLDLQPVR